MNAGTNRLPVTESHCRRQATDSLRQFRFHCRFHATPSPIELRYFAFQPAFVSAFAFSWLSRFFTAEGLIDCHAVFAFFQG